MPQYQRLSYFNTTSSIAKTLLSSAVAPYQVADWYARIFARVKLRIDPAFVTILKQGLVPDGARLLDLGCGQGLLASILFAAREMHREGCWPEAWPAPPTLGAFHGIDSVPLDIERAKRALHRRASFEVADISHKEFEQSDVIVILDVLHYMDYQAQEDVLRRVSQALPAGGRLILRVGDADGGFWFKCSYWYDRTIWFLRVHQDNPLFCRPLHDWLTLLESLGLSTRMVPLDHGISLANALLVSTRT
ncbi:MAG TPA: class I SAM-dependent methyltransferase [Methylophilaceae bacterium]|nr:class I SAM-dependent methyltransferase [Methylophilaceae bacterium]